MIEGLVYFLVLLAFLLFWALGKNVRSRKTRTWRELDSANVTHAIRRIQRPK